MENRYLYRGKRIDNGEWIVGSLIVDKHQDIETGEQIEITGIYPSEYKGFSKRIDPSTICQCTGLKDKSSKLIFENDIVNCLTEECCGYIGWNESEAGFYFNVLLEDGRFEEEHIYDYQDCIEVIGNTFDNRELPERSDHPEHCDNGRFDAGWNACLDAIEGGVHEQKQSK